MKKSYKLKDVDCANCAAKIERAISKLEGVSSVKINFMSQRMVLEAPEDTYDGILAAACKAGKKIAAGFTILV